MHAEVLNYMMANTCHHIGGDDGDVGTYTFDLHCVEVTVVARFIGDWSIGDARYEIISWKSEAI